MQGYALWKWARAAMLLCIALLFCVLQGASIGYAQETMEEADAEVVESVEVEVKDTGVSVVPVVANEKAKPRDIIKKELLLKNDTTRRVDLYVTVNNVDPLTGDQVFDQPGLSDLSTSLANWIEITRGVITLSPGESRKIPYLIHVNLTAQPGSYFARIAFHPGLSRVKAEATETDVELILNLEVLDDANERLQLGNFITDSTVVFGDTVGFSYLLENVGNRLVEPRGAIRIFNRRGEEVGSLPLNADGEEITPENKRQLAAAWGASGRFGKYKAFLDLEYGEQQLASVQDTVYFWVFPWKEIMVALIGVLVLAVIGTYIVHMRAIARPSPARVYTPQPTEPEPRMMPVHPVATAASARMQPSVSGPGAPTVVLATRKAPNPPAGASRVGTAAVPQRVQPRVQVQGNTVHLASRR